MGSAAPFLIFAIAIVGVASLGYLYRTKPKVKELVHNSERDVITAMINFSPLIIAFIPFLLDFMEAQNIAPFAERILEQKESSAFLIIVTLLGVSSFMGIIMVYSIGQWWNLEEVVVVDKDSGKKSLVKKRVWSWGSFLISVGCAAVLMSVQWWILTVGYTVHVIPHSEEPDSLEMKYGLNRYFTQQIYVGVNIAISFFAAIWAYHLDAKQEKAKLLADFKKNNGRDFDEDDIDDDDEDPEEDEDPEDQDDDDDDEGDNKSKEHQVGGFSKYLPSINRWFGIPEEEFSTWIYEKIGVNLDEIKKNQHKWTEKALCSSLILPDNIKNARGNDRLELALKEMERLIKLIVGESNSQHGLAALSELDKQLSPCIEDADALQEQLKALKDLRTTTPEEANKKTNDKGRLERELGDLMKKIEEFKAKKTTMKLAITNNLQKESFNMSSFRSYDEYKR